MDILTAVIGALFVFFLLRGAFRGFSGELAPLVGLIAFIGTLWYGYPPVQSNIQHAIPTIDAGALIFYSALTTTILACISFGVLCILIKKLFTMLLPQPFNALLGALIGAAKVVLMVSVVGGLLAVAEDRFKQLREQTEQNPFSAMVAQFWINRFNNLDILQSTKITPSQQTETTPMTPHPESPRRSI